MNCSNGKKYLDGIQNGTVLNNKLEQAIDDIREVLFPEAQSPNVNQIMPYKTKVLGRQQLKFLPADVRVYELSEQDWRLTVPRQFHDARAIQISIFNKILLRRDNWCRKTMIHEALHSLSIFNSDDNLRTKFPIFEEGVTEFLTGYVLYKNWKSKIYSICSISYSRTVKRFYAFCNFVDVKSLVQLYFLQEGRTWKVAWSEFLDEIHNSGYPNFRDVTGMFGEPTEYFFDECEKHFRSRFRTLYCSKLDYDDLIDEH